MLEHGLFFLTENRINQYNWLLYTLENNIKKWELLPDEAPNYNPFSLDNPKNILRNVWYFKDWFVGFTVAEGSFFIQKNKEICFSIGQKGNKTLIQAIHTMFEPAKLAVQFSKKDNFYKFRLSSAKDIQKVINFFSFENHYPLVGYKKNSYEIWIKALKASSRYKDLKLP